MNEDAARRVPALRRWLAAAKATIGLSATLSFVAFGCFGLIARGLPKNGVSRSVEYGVAVLLIVAVALLGIAVVAVVVGVVVQTRLRYLLQESGGMLCPGCGYNLTGVESGSCPECGRKYDPKGVAREWQDEYATALPRWEAEPGKRPGPTAADNEPTGGTQEG